MKNYTASASTKYGCSQSDEFKTIHVLQYNSFMLKL